VNDDKLDLSALDPARDSERWEQRIGQVVARAVVARAVVARRWSIGGQLRSWARPALGLAAAAAVFSWLGLILRWQDQAPLSTSQNEEAVSVLSRWAASDEQPSASRMLSVLGGSP